MKDRWAVVAIPLVLGGALQAQDSLTTPAPRAWSRGVVHYGKWVTAATAVGFTILAAREHDRAQNEWRRLLALCRDNNAACQLRADGQYVDYNAEVLFQKTGYYDRRARSRLIGGQVALLVSAALFILDLRHQSGEPPNIPFQGLQLTAEPAGSGAEVGVRVPF